MKNIRKIGLTALAGSLVAFSANAVEWSASVSPELTYTSKSGTTKGGVDGNNWGFEKGMSLSASGEIMGYSVSLSTVLSDAYSFSTSALTFDLGDMGKVCFDDGSGCGGIGSLENKGNVSAYEEADHGMTDMHLIDANGAQNAITYTSPAGMLIDGLDFSIEYKPNIGAEATTGAGATSGAGSIGSEWNTAVNYSVAGIEGLKVYAGYASESSSGTRDDDTEMTIGAEYAIGPIKVGYQHSEIEDATAAGQEVTAMGVNFAVNDDLTVSISTTENTKNAIAATASSSSEATGFSAAYSVGGGSLRIFTGEQDNAGYTSGVTKKMTEVSLSMTF